ncbi:hypothetical protein [Catellatospora sp. NPDC049609]|uniref:hypothetical protein n=1 Tax=Catellatospora sp. NPDC049609 TaxID=3155505 RepID=UPI00342D0183
MEAAGIVLSDEVAVLWGRLLEREGLTTFCEKAMPQFIRWESQYGWTLRGYGKVAEKETPLATVLERMLPCPGVPDSWTVAADAYLAALDQLTPVNSAKSSRRRWSEDHVHRERAGSLALWHELLLDRFAGTDEEDRLDRLTTHPALDGPEIVFLWARLAHRRGDTDSAPALMQECLDALPGHRDFLDFAAEIGAPLPERARRAGRHGW